MTKPTMKGLNLRLAMPSVTVLVAVMFAGTTRAQDASTVSNKEVEAKPQYCEVCTRRIGARLSRILPDTAPRRTASRAYIENQLKGFSERKRTNNIMFNVGHMLSPAMITALANGFHDLSPKPLGNAPRELVAAGKQVYEEGVPSANVVACASCHGKEAKGSGQFPRLAGQLYTYVSLQLTNWSKERAENNSHIMAPIARSLTETQIKAVAAYVSYLE
jgi:cytochrome c553